ncbi:hypothetical protein [Antrihabitans spumae]|uniref:XRE family transcriptional regulator n=1 Tax=Antrihabitans spumae TaxID=3373370 RepID=A0ABW7KBN5_9NOCA
MPTLAELITRQKDGRGWSYRNLAARADDVLTAQRWQQLGSGVRIAEFPEPATLQAIADAIEVDIAAVVLAAARSIGLDVRQQRSELATMLPVNSDLLTAQQRDAVVAVVRAIANDKADALTRSNQGEPIDEPSTPADAGLTNLRPLPSHRDRVAVENGWDGDLADLAGAARKGETEERKRRRLTTAPEDESQDPGSDEPS